MTTQEPGAEDRPAGDPWAAPEQPQPAPQAPPAPPPPPPPDGHPAFWPTSPPPATGYGPPPQAGWPAPPVPWTSRLRSTAGLATPLLVLSVAVAVCDVASAATSFDAVDRYQQAVAEGRDPSGVVTAHDLVSIPEVVVLLAAWVVASIWLTRARGNAEAISPTEIRRSPAWAWLGWFVPIVSFWFPKQIVDDSWQVTDRAVGEQRPAARRRTVTRWWALWIAYLLLSNVVSRLAFQGDATNHGVYPALEVAVAVASLAALTAWFPVVRGLTDAQSRLAATANP